MRLWICYLAGFVRGLFIWWENPSKEWHEVRDLKTSDGWSVVFVRQKVKVYRIIKATPVTDERVTAWRWGYDELLETSLKTIGTMRITYVNVYRELTPEGRALWEKASERSNEARKSTGDPA